MGAYRKCAGIVVFNKNKKVLVCARNDSKQYNWQFPQGGMEENETALQAAVRELKEETSIVSVKHVTTLDKPLRYNYPDDVLASGRKHIGQEMYWSLMFFYGDDDEINLNTQEPEFKAFEWIDSEESLNRIIPFKKDVYKKVIEQFTPIIIAFDKI